MYSRDDKLICLILNFFVRLLWDKCWGFCHCALYIKELFSDKIEVWAAWINARNDWGSTEMILQENV